MLKLSLLVGLFLPVASTVLESPSSPISNPLTSEQTTQEKALQILSFIKAIQNGLPNNRTTPGQTEITPTLPISIPITPTPTPT